MDINVCIPTLNRPDLLGECIRSLQQGDLKPTHIRVIDNGGMFMNQELQSFMDEHGIIHSYYSPGFNMGVAASWNHFINGCSDYLVICNDDICFQPDSLQKLIDAFNPDQMACPENIIGGNAFSCFLMPHALIERVGYFDESISPNYGYHEDNDYSRRLILAGYGIQPAPECRVDHFLSATMRNYSDEQMNDHHQRFELSRSNYVQKWGGIPGQETYTTPYGR